MGKTMRDYSDLPRMKVVGKGKVDRNQVVDEEDDLIYYGDVIHDLLDDADDDYSDIQDFY